LLPRRVAEREPTLIRLETQSEPEPRVIWQTVHVDLQRSARIRAVLEFLQSVLRSPNAESAEK
jgi:DNA-binding transcriptional LysR family regulator